MAGEWIQYDACLPQKPEVIELVDRTGLEAGTVIGRMLMLWGWATLNCQEGRARISVRLLCRLVGGDEAFWEAVQDVGWLEIDAEGGTVRIPGWDRRFSQAAKSRALSAVRHASSKAKTAGAPTGGARRPQLGRAAPPVGARGAPERRDRGDRISSSSPPGAALDEEGPEPADGPPAGWETLRAAWKAGKGRAWQLPTPPDRTADRLDEEGWFAKALAAIDRLPACRYFRDPVTLPQFVAPGFVDKILGGQFDNAREQPARGGFRGPDDRPPPQSFTGSDLEAFERTKRAMADRIRQEGAA